MCPYYSLLLAVQTFYLQRIFSVIITNLANILPKTTAKWSKVFMKHFRIQFCNLLLLWHIIVLLTQGYSYRMYSRQKKIIPNERMFLFHSIARQAFLLFDIISISLWNLEMLNVFSLFYNNHFVVGFREWD